MNLKSYIKQFSVLACLLFFTLFFISCKKDNTTGSAEIPNLLMLENAFTKAAQIESIHSLVVWHNGSIIKESYFERGTSTTPHDVRSVTKSVISILVGIAIDKNYIQSVNQSINDFLQPIGYSLTSEQKNITIKHLLTMSSGIEWNELTNVSEYNNWISSPDQVKFLLNRSLTSPPGKVFNYNSAALHLLSVIITQASKMNTLEFARKFLFEPLGISITKWEVDKQGYYNGGAGLNITPLDMIKIGRLEINKGLYNSTQIVSASWIENSISSIISTNNANPYGYYYGYGWWTGSNSNFSYAFANGWGGQFIFVVPSLNVIVSATNTWSGVGTTKANEHWMQTINIIMNDILPSFYSNSNQ